MSAFYNEIAAVGTSFTAQDAPLVTLGFTPDFWVVQNLDATNELEYSFDGVNVHGRLPETGNAQNAADRSEPTLIKATKLWVRAAAGTVTVAVRAWSS